MRLRSREILRRILACTSQFLPWCFCLAFMVLAIVRLSVPAVGTFRDDGVYLSSAQSIVQGRGYRLLNIPGELPNTKYPPLTSFIAAIPYAAGKDPIRNPFVFKGSIFMFYLMWLYSIYRIGSVAAIGTKAQGWILACTMANSLAAYCGTSVLSDVPAAALTTAGIAALLKSFYGRRRPMIWAALAGFAFGLAVLTRTFAAAMIIPMILFLAKQRLFKRLACVAVLCFVISAPWFVWAGLQFGSGGNPVLDYYTGRNYQDWWVWNSEENRKWPQVVFANAIVALAAPVVAAGLRNVFVGVFVSSLCLLLCFRALKRPLEQAL